MQRDTAIYIRNTGNISINYLKRMFSKVGTVIDISRVNNQCIIVNFKHSNSTQKALKFNGRKLNNNSLIVTTKNEKNNQPKIVRIMQKNKIKPKLPNNVQQLWSFIQQFCDDIETSFLISGWIYCKIQQIIHFFQYNINLRTSYQELAIQKAILDKLAASKYKQRKNVLQNHLELNYEFPRKNQEQSKIMCKYMPMKYYELFSDTTGSYILVQLMKQLQFQSRKLNFAQVDLNWQCLLENIVKIKDHNINNSFTGLIDRIISCQDFFYDLLTYKSPNIVISIGQDSLPIIMSSSLKLSHCFSKSFQSHSYSRFYHIYNKNQLKEVIVQTIDRVNLNSHCSLVFQQGYFSISDTIKNVKKWIQIEQFFPITILYLIQIQQENFNFLKNQFISMVNLLSDKIQLYVIIIMPSKLSQFNYQKCQQFIMDYIDNEIFSREMAVSLASNVLNHNEFDSYQWINIQQCNHGNTMNHLQQYVGAQIWRIYRKSQQRRTKNLVNTYAHSIKKIKKQ